MPGLPEPSTLVWLASQPKDSRRPLADALCTTAATDQRYFEEVLAVWQDDYNVGGEPALRALAAVRRARVAEVFYAELFAPVADTALPQARLMQLIKHAARTCAFAARGDAYVANRLAMVTPGWRCVSVPYALPPYRSTAEAFAEDVNDIVRPVLETSIKSILTDGTVDFAVPMQDSAALAAIAALQEGFDGHPRVFVNHAAATAPEQPCILSFTDAELPFRGWFVKSGDKLHPQHQSSAVHMLVCWLACCRDAGASGAVAELAAFVLDGAANSVAARLRAD